MIDFSAEEIARETAAQLVVSSQDVCFSECVIDSRRVSNNCIFVAFKGETQNGNVFAESALAKGAAGVVLSEEPSAALLACARTQHAFVLRAEHDDCEEFLLRLAHAKRQKHPEYIVIAVTGSCGKTTTKDMLLSVMSSHFKSFATPGNYNNLIGLPLTLLMAPQDVEVIICEMGMNHLHELDRMSLCARPNLAIITNIGTSHIGLLGSRENIARAKAEVLKGLVAPLDASFEPCLLLSQDDDFTPFIIKHFALPNGITTRLVGLCNASPEGATSAASDPSDSSDSSAYASPLVHAANIHVEDIAFDTYACPSCTYVYAAGAREALRLPHPGETSVLDSLFALELAEILHVPRKKALSALAHMPVVHMRLEEIKRPHTPLIINDSYNASPSSIAGALAVLQEIDCRGRRIAVLGEVGELGDQAHLLHGYIGSFVAGQALDLIVFIGDAYAEDMYRAYCIMGGTSARVLRYQDVAEAITEFPNHISEDDCVLIKASRAAQLDLLVDHIVSTGDTKQC